MNRRTRPSLSGGFALAAVTVLVCLLLGEAVSRSLSGGDVDAFFVDWHFNDRGNALAARLIAAALAADKE